MCIWFLQAEKKKTTPPASLNQFLHLFRLILHVTIDKLDVW